MGKCKKCGKYCDDLYKYCKDCYEDYYIDTCIECGRPLYNDKDKDLIMLIGDNKKIFNDFDKNVLYFIIFNEVIHDGDYLLHRKYGLLKIISIEIDKYIFLESLLTKEKHKLVFDYRLILNGVYHFIPKDIYLNMKENFNFSENIDQKLNTNFDKNINFNSSLVREKYESTYRTEDGHLVRSRGELLIDNYLFNHNIKHVYEKIVIDPINDNECTCDFYLPDYDVYIEFWGLDNKEYNKTKEYKLKIYENAKLNLVNIEPEDVDKRLDYVLNKVFIKYKK